MQTRIVEMIGYFSDRESDEPGYIEGCPDPADIVGEWRSREREAVVAYLRSGVPFRQYMGASTCRLCEESTGSTELTDGQWGWPEGLAHYVVEHGVQLPEAIVEAARSEREIPAGLRDEIGQPQVYLEGGSGPAIPADSDEVPRVEFRFGAWLDWAAANTPARPRPGAISLEAARSIAAELSHNSWQAVIEPLHDRWKVRFEPDGEHIYLQCSPARVLRQCLATRRTPDPEGILEVEEIDRIAGEYDGEWGAARVLAVAPGAWFVWVKPVSSEWPGHEELKKETGKTLEFGWTRFHPDDSQSFAIPEMDEFAWRSTLERLRAQGEARLDEDVQS